MRKGKIYLDKEGRLVCPNSQGSENVRYGEGAALAEHIYYAADQGKRRNKIWIIQGF